MKYWIPYVVILMAYGMLLSCDRMGQVDDHYEIPAAILFDVHVPEATTASAQLCWWCEYRLDHGIDDRRYEDAR